MLDPTEFNPYALSPEEWASMSIDQTDKALGWVLGQLVALHMKMRNIRIELFKTSDDDTIGELEWQLKLLRQEESSLHRLESGFQSRLKVA